MWVIGLPMGALIWLAMVGPTAGAISLTCALVSFGALMFFKKKR
jgi:hypothetical protein